MIKKFVFAADLHITDKVPRYRKDDYVKTGLRKLEWVVDIANSMEAVLCIAGDFFDRPTIPYEILNRVTSILRKCNYTPICIAGQHDMVDKVKDLENTPLYNLWINRKIVLLSSGLHLDNVWGTHYGESKPANLEYSENSVIMIHKSVTPEEPPWFLSDAISAEDAAKEYSEFKIVVAGDYHKPFYKEINGVHIINCGPMLRAEKDKREMEPCVWYVSLEENEVSVVPVPIPISAQSDVFDVESIEYDEKNSITLDTSKLKELVNKGIENLDFNKIVFAVYENNEFDSLSKKDVENILSGVL